MNELTYPAALLLGVVQGLTEFLPISSDGHLAIIQHLLTLPAESTPMIAFDLVVHVGTLLPVAIVFAPPFLRFLRRLVAESTPAFGGRREAWPMVGLGFAASVATAAVGLTLEDPFQKAYGNPFLIALGFVATGLVLALPAFVTRGRRGWRRFGWWRAVLIGAGQGLAIYPGLSRSGTTISLALLTGIKRRWAAQFSFFIAFPAICGAALLKGKDLLETPGFAAGYLLRGPYLVGAITAAIVGYVALRLLLKLVQKARLHYLAIYCWLLAVVTLITLR